MSYNGWTNYETWNLALWVDNEYGWYQLKCDMIDQLEEVEAEHVQGFYVNYMDATTPDIKGLQEAGEPIDINYGEIAEHWEEERKERATLQA